MRPAKAKHLIVRTARALLMMAEGVPGTDIARVLAVHVRASSAAVCLTSHDDEFREMRDDVLGGYYEAPRRQD